MCVCVCARGGVGGEMAPSGMRGEEHQGLLALHTPSVMLFPQYSVCGLHHISFVVFSSSSSMVLVSLSHAPAANRETLLNLRKFTLPYVC